MKVEFRNISKTYPSGDKKLQILDSASFQIPSGGMVAIRGESGSGKSTLLSLIGLLDNPDSVEEKETKICLDGQNILPFTLAEKTRMTRQIGFVFQKFHLLASLTLLENVALPLKIRRESNGEKEAQKLLKQVGLEGRTHHLPNEVSGGEIQRACIARALVSQPRLILADEPTGNLDEKNSEGVISLLQNLVNEKQSTLICVTHSKKVSSVFPCQWEMENIKQNQVTYKNAF